MFRQRVTRPTAGSSKRICSSKCVETRHECICSSKRRLSRERCFYRRPTCQTSPPTSVHVFCSLMDTLPDEVSIEAWVKARNVEIAALAEECKVKLPQQMSQRLPRYMRRRAASGNPKRIPKSVRPWWLDEKPSVKKKKKQKPKRIPASLAIRSRNKRNQDPTRSPIHVWLAKRFKIQLMWNRRIAWSNCTKNQRSLFRKSKSSYCIYYLSNFMRCIRSDLVQSNTYTSPIEFEFEGEKFMFVHACDRQDSSPGSDEDASDLFQLVRLVGPKGSEVAASLPQDKCILQSGQMDEKRPFVDIISVRGSFKQHIWPILSKNKGHLVGGLRDWCMLHLNSNLPCFPFFGFPNSVHSPNYQRFGPGKRILTDLAVGEKKTSDLLVPVVITATARGTPSEGDDIICPESNCLLGHVEYGGYCMEAGRGKGFGALFVEKLSDPVTPASVAMKIEFKCPRTGNRYPGKAVATRGRAVTVDQSGLGSGSSRVAGTQIDTSQ